MNVRVFEVEYNNYTFRSKTEAKWARLFDLLNIEYVYEPDTYVLLRSEKRKIRYLPDFYLPEQDLFLEVKNMGNKKPTIEECLKAYLLATHVKKRVLIAFGDVTFNANVRYGNYLCYHPNGIVDLHYRLTRCTMCKKIDFTKFGNVFDIHCDCEKNKLVHETLINTTAVKAAFDKLKSYRFGW